MIRGLFLLMAAVFLVFAAYHYAPAALNQDGTLSNFIDSFFKE